MITQKLFRKSVGLPALLLLTLVGGCALPAAAPVLPPAPAETFIHRPLIIIESSGSPVFVGVSMEIARRWPGPKQIFRLSGDEQTDAQIQQSIARSDTALIAAIGLEAAIMARHQKAKRVVFCQTFNYEDRDLIQPWMRGVSPLPPASEQFRIWKTLDPKLKKIAVITGPRLTLLMKDAQAAAQAAHIALYQREVKSDLEAVFVTKQLLRDVDGVWLVPDNRILSRRSLQEIVALGHRHGKQVTVFGTQLLSLGALLSIEAEPADIAAQVIARLKDAVKNAPNTAPAITPLTRMDFRVNAVVARQLNLRIPPSFNNKLYAP